MVAGLRVLKRVLMRNRSHSMAPASLPIPPKAWQAWLDSYQPETDAEPVRMLKLATHVYLSVCGNGLDHWGVHFWLQRLPLVHFGMAAAQTVFVDPHNLQLTLEEKFAVSDGLQRIALNLELPASDRAEHWFAHLLSQQIVFDPDPARVSLLRALGLNAQWLDPVTPSNGWLRVSDSAQHLWGVRFGLSAPLSCHCLALGGGGMVWEHALADWECRGEQPAIVYLPQLPANAEDQFTSARLLASWLWAQADTADHVVVLAAEGFASDPALRCLSGQALPLFQPPITPAELIAELAGEQQVFAEDRPSPDFDLLYSSDTHQSPQAAVLISLYNYSAQIKAALDSVAMQTLSALELLVVDDASTDDGETEVLAWLEQHGPRFCRVQLLRHRVNAGLAAARNTAFAACTAKWAFVLDADNVLFPGAVEACLRLTAGVDPAVAVIHPWVEVLGDCSYGHDGRSLISNISWQRKSFLRGNVIDAMALVRCSAWKDVGGYTHIEGGWEDFDFWCKLIEAGYHGLLCPRILARYHTHSNSMTASSTANLWRPLSRCLQERHPWLELPYAT